MMKYKGYTAAITIDEEQGIFHGEVLDLVDVVTFQGRTVEELTEAFHESVDDYLAFCEERGEPPEKPFSGRFMVRIEPELHRKCSVAARLRGKSLNAWVAGVLERAAEESGEPEPPSKPPSPPSREPIAHLLAILASSEFTGSPASTSAEWPRSSSWLPTGYSPFLPSQYVFWNVVQVLSREHLHEWLGKWPEEEKERLRQELEEALADED